MHRVARVVKRTLIPGSITFLVAGLAIGVVLLDAGPSAGEAGRAWLTALLALYGLLSLPIVANSLVDGLGQGHRSLEAAIEARGAKVLAVIGNGSAHYAMGDLVADQLTRRSTFCVFEAVRLGRLIHPEWIIASGGTSYEAGIPESELIRDQLTRFGVPAATILLESTSHTTDEQVANVVRLFASHRLSGPLVVVTTAAHMPRVMTLFKARSVDAVGSVPGGLRYDEGATGWRRWRPAAAALRGSESAMYEYLARVYAATRRHRVAPRLVENAREQPS